MNINHKLLQAVRQRTDYDYALYQLEPFLQSLDFSLRLDMAKGIIRELAGMYGKGLLVKYINELAVIEKSIYWKHPHHRDHVVHAVLTFALGIWIDSELLLGLVDPFQWTIASLFHDIGYPLEINGKTRIQRWADTINDVRTRLEPGCTRIPFDKEPTRLKELCHGRNSFDLLDNYFQVWGLSGMTADRCVTKSTIGMNMNHGVISALMLLHLIDLMYSQSPEWHQSSFQTDIVPVCAAIFLHALKPSDGWEKGVEISPAHAPLAFLLKLSDSLQEWDRPRGKNRQYYSASDFDINIENGKLVFHTERHPDVKDHILKDLRGILDLSSVEIC